MLKSRLPNLKQNIELKNHTTFRIGGPAAYFLVAESKDDFKKALRAAKETQTPFYLLGGGSNMLVSDNGFEGLVVKTQNSKLKTQSHDSKIKTIELEAGFLFNKLIFDTVKAGYSGVEWGFGIPGTVGGAICGNAGRLGQDISSVVEKVEILDENLNKKILSREDCGFGYRESRFKKTGEIILGATLKFKKKEPAEIEEVFSQAKDVILHSPKFPSAGCAFKNYKLSGEGDQLLQNHPELRERVRGGKIGVGYLIDQCGLKGQKIGGAQIWEGHANYIVNLGGATAKDVKSLMDKVVVAVEEKYGILLEPEIRFLGF